MSLEMVNELHAVLAQLDGRTRAVVISGAGGHFCAGADVKDLVNAGNQLQALNRAFGTLLQAVEAVPQVVIVVLQGAVLGGGFGLACVSDIALADHQAQFGLPETSLGLLPAQIAPFVVKRIGLTQARRLALTAARFDGVEAQRLGVVHFTERDPQALAERLDEVLGQVLRCAPGANERTRNSWRPQSVKPSKGPLVKEGEVAAVLTRTWGFLSSLQGEEVVDERLDTARDVIYLSLYTPPAATPASKKNGENFRNLLVGVPVSLNFHLSWPLELFLQPSDLEEYDSLFAYLISVRKIQMKLQSLWKGRRNPIQNASKSRVENRDEAKGYRETLKARDARERNIWATTGVAIFFLETLVDYFVRVHPAL